MLVGNQVRATPSGMCRHLLSASSANEKRSRNGIVDGAFPDDSSHLR